MLLMDNLVLLFEIIIGKKSDGSKLSKCAKSKDAVPTAQQSAPALFLILTSVNTSVQQVEQVFQPTERMLSMKARDGFKAADTATLNLSFQSHFSWETRTQDDKSVAASLSSGDFWLLILCDD